MNPRLPRPSAREVIAVLKRRGFSLERSSGSHQIFVNSEGLRVTVPVHPGRAVLPKTLRSILGDADMTIEDLIKEL